MLFQRLVRPSLAFRRVHFQPATARRFLAKIAPVEPAIPKVPALKLRSYQEECIQAVLEHQEKGHRRLGVSLATGGGKTVIFTELIGRVKPLSPLATQTLILVHRRELVEQAALQCQRMYPEKRIEIEMAQSHSSGTADITVASIMSLRSQDRIEKFDPERFKLILIDEAHHAAAKSYLDALAHFDALRPDAPVNVVGVSATMSRMDGVKLGSVMDHIVYHRDFVTMIDEGWLSKMVFTTVKTNIDLSKVKVTGDDFNVGELSQAVNTDEANEITVKSWLNRAADRKSTLVFCVDIAHVQEMANKFRAYGYEAQLVTSESHTKHRSEILRNFKAGNFPVLVNCGIFTEGTDIPNIDCVVLARPTRSKNLLVQMIGRGMRLHPGKEDCHVLDMVGSVTKGIVTTPTLYGLDPSDVVDGMSPEKMKELVKKKEKEKEKKKEQLAAQFKEQAVKPPIQVTFTDYETVHDLVADQKADQWIRLISQFAWVGVGYSKYILGIKDRGFIRLEKEEDGKWVAWYTQNLPDYAGTMLKPFASFMRPRKIVEGTDDLEQAVHAADTFAEGRSHRMLLMHRAPWRSKPASPAQMDVLRRLLPDEKLKKYTMGMAGDMITKIKHGAKKELDKIQVQQRKAAKEALRQSKQDHIGVGPLNSIKEKLKKAKRVRTKHNKNADINT